MSDFESKRISEIANQGDPQDKSIRSHERHSLADQRIASIMFPGNLTGTIRDLSYGGISIEFPKSKAKEVQKMFDTEEKICVGELRLAKEAIPTKLSLVRLVGRKAAFTFIHDSAETLVFLREVLEPMRIGTTLKPIQGFKGEEWRNMRFTLKGDALSELDLMINQEGSLLFSRLTFSNQGYLFEVTLKDESIHTGVAVLNFGSAAQTKNTKLLDLRLLRQSVFILLGFHNEVISDQKSELIDLILAEIDTAQSTLSNEPAA